MKKTLFITVVSLLIFTLSAKAQKNVKSKLEKVTIYPSNALVEKSAKLTLTKGENTFIITDNATDIQTSNLHFGANDNYFISSCSIERTSQTIESKAKDVFPANVYNQYITLKNKIESNEKQLSTNKYLLQVYNAQLKALNNLKAIKNTQTIDTLLTIQQQFEYQRTEGVKIKSEINRIEKENTSIEELLSKQQAQLNEIVKQNNDYCDLTRQSSNIIVSIFAKKDMVATLNYNYLVYNVSSQYSYDVMIDENNKLAIFNLKNTVSQSTNENWSNCKIVFSTNDELYAEGDTDLPTWELKKNATSHNKRRVNMLSNNIVLAANATGVQAKTDNVEEGEMYSIQSADVSNLTLSKEYTLNTHQSIGSNSKQAQTIPLVSDSTKIEFKHFSTPKNIEKVYFTTLLPEWESLGLLNTSCDIFLNDKYVAKSYINTLSTKDTMQLSAGEDKEVKISRKVVKTSPDKSFLSNNIEQTVNVTLVVKNTKSTPINISLKDQVPISQDTDIKIFDIKTNDGTLNSSTGIIKWNINLEGKQTKEVKFSYTIKYPKNLNLELN